jgi:hypothetical protein
MDAILLVYGGVILSIGLIIFSFYLWRKEKKGVKYIIEF